MANLNELLNKAIYAKEINNNDEFINFSYRASPKTASMIEVMHLIMEEPINSLFTNQISDAICDWLLSDSNNIELLDSFINDSLKFDTQDFEFNLGFIKQLKDAEVIEEKFSLF